MEGSLKLFEILRKIDPCFNYDYLIFSVLLCFPVVAPEGTDTFYAEGRAIQCWEDLQDVCREVLAYRRAYTANVNNGPVVSMFKNCVLEELKVSTLILFLFYFILNLNNLFLN